MDRSNQHPSNDNKARQNPERDEQINHRAKSLKMYECDTIKYLKDFL